jgi:hypothetical protein
VTGITTIRAPLLPRAAGIPPRRTLGVPVVEGDRRDPSLQSLRNRSDGHVAVQGEAEAGERYGRRDPGSFEGTGAAVTCAGRET